MDKKNLFYKTFLNYYLGILDSHCLHNATRSWLMAKGYDPEMSSKPIIDKRGQKTYRPEYNTARTEASLLLANPNIRALKDKMLKEAFDDPQNAKNRLVELAMQNTNLSVAVSANKTMLTMFGLLSNKVTVDFTELDQLTKMVTKVLTK
jgi:hypothetical protein